MKESLLNVKTQSNNSMDVRAKQRLCYRVVRLTQTVLVAVSPHVISAVGCFRYGNYSIAATTKFTSEMEKLRRTGFHSSSPETSSSDDFDKLSIHILAIIRNEIIGMIRLTLEPPSVLQTWSSWKAPIPTGEGVIDVTRGVVAKQWRGFDIYKLLMTETMIKAKELGTKVAVAPIKPDFQHRAFLSNIGFRNVGEPLIFKHSPIGETFTQYLVQLPQEDFDKVIGVRAKIVHGERMKNFRVVSTIELK